MKELGSKIKNFAVAYYNRAHKLELLLVGAIAVTLVNVGIVTVENRGWFVDSWIISCDDYEGHSYNLEVPTKPYVRDGFIFIDGRTFVTTKPMSTCMIVPSNEAVMQIEGQSKVL